MRAIARRHFERIERIRARMAAQAAGSDDLRDWVACLVRPAFEHLAALDGPTWFGRFGELVMSDPVLRAITVEDSLTSPSLHAVLAGVNRCLPQLPPAVRAERDDMARHLIVRVTAERERELADGRSAPDWSATATGLVDAIVGLFLAPVT